MSKEEFNLSEKRERLSEYLREQGLSVKTCSDILRVVISQDKEFIKLLKKTYYKYCSCGGKRCCDDCESLFKDLSKEIDKLAGEKLK